MATLDFFVSDPGEKRPRRAMGEGPSPSSDFGVPGSDEAAAGGKARGAVGGSSESILTDIPGCRVGRWRV